MCLSLIKLQLNIGNLGSKHQNRSHRCKGLLNKVLVSKYIVLIRIGTSLQGQADKKWAAVSGKLKMSLF